MCMFWEVRVSVQGFFLMQGLSWADGLPDPLNTLSYILGLLHSWNSCREVAPSRHEALLPCSQVAPGLYLRGTCLELASRLAEVGVRQCHACPYVPPGVEECIFTFLLPFPKPGHQIVATGLLCSSCLKPVFLWGHRHGSQCG